MNRSLLLFLSGACFVLLCSVFINILGGSSLIPTSSATGLPRPPFTCMNQPNQTPTCIFNSYAGTTFSGINLKNAYLLGFDVQGGNLSSSDLTNAYLYHCRIGDQVSGNDFSGTNFTGANISFCMNIEESNFTGANFTGTNLQNISNEGNNDYTDANFTNADLTSSNFESLGTDTFTGATWSNTICPDGTNSDDDSDTCVNNLTP